MPWIDACATGDIDEEDLIRWDHAGKTFAIYHSPEGEFFATAGLCTHENVHLCDGLVMGNLIECPKHNGRFDIRSGQACAMPCDKPLRTWPVQVVDGQVCVEWTGPAPG